MSYGSAFRYGFVGALAPEIVRFFKVVNTGQPLPHLNWFGSRRWSGPRTQTPPFQAKPLLLRNLAGSHCKPHWLAEDVPSGNDPSGNYTEPNSVYQGRNSYGRNHLSKVIRWLTKHILTTQE